jgi:pimeloyl-ACP methyl ester carboxylesterase
MATFVLVHGAWHGGWCWRKVGPLLRGAGHDVYTPTLTGLGERAHLLTPAVNLETHIQDVQGLLCFEDLSEVILVAHSYGGMVITGVANEAADRLAHLVYLDAFVPADGQALGDLAPIPPRREGADWRILPPPDDFGVTAHDDLQWLHARLGDQPLASFVQPVRLTDPRALALPRTYLYCAEKGGEDHIFGPDARRLRSAEGWRYAEVRSGHDAMITAPQDLARHLLDLA